MRTTVLCIALLSFPAFPASPVRYSSSGLGFHLGVSFLDPPAQVNAVGAAFDAGVQADIAFSLGLYGAFHYLPAVGTLFGSDRNGDLDYSLVEVFFDVADFKYTFPLPFEVVKPYIGIGVMFAWNRWSWEYYAYQPVYPLNRYIAESHDDGFEPGFNFFGGSDFKVTRTVSLFAELRGKVGGGLSAFKMLAGLNFLINGSY